MEEEHAAAVAAALRLGLHRFDSTDAAVQCIAQLALSGANGQNFPLAALGNRR
jgi:hypothetical protein